jgi:hypothetical protein
MKTRRLVIALSPAICLLVALPHYWAQSPAVDDHGCVVLGKKYEKSLDQYTKMGRVAWSPRLQSCIAETTNIVAGTEMYAITSLPSEKNEFTSGGTTSWLDKNRGEETAKRDSAWQSLVAEKKN